MGSLKWIISLLLIGIGALVLSQPSVVSNFRVLPEQSSAVPEHSFSYKKITELENRLSATNFDPRLRDHIVRQQRIQYYVERAKTFHRNEWYYNRDDVLTRARKILDHHENTESSAYASL